MIVFAVYQDCVFCKEKGKKELKKLVDAGVEVQKVSFATSKGVKLTPKALKSGINKFPYYTDGDKFFSSVDEVLEYKNKKENKKNEGEKIERDGENTRLRAGSKTKKSSGRGKKKTGTKGNARAKKSD